ncbi:MAG: N-6 DNA methylase [Candidatus Thorarchaeota archaeon]|nr:N-6 DNA methylase [Candidatus Thorarchaeota archaeon]
MEYDLEFLKAHGLMVQEHKGSLAIRGTEVEFHYDRANRLLYFNMPPTLTPQEIVAVVTDSMLVDYIWFWGDHLEVFRLIDRTCYICKHRGEALFDEHEPGEFDHTGLERLFSDMIGLPDFTDRLPSILDSLRPLERERSGVMHGLLFRFFTIIFLIQMGMVTVKGAETIRDFGERLLLSSVGPDLAIPRIITGDGMGLVDSTVAGVSLSQILETLFGDHADIPHTLPPFAGSYLANFIKNYAIGMDDTDQSRSLTLQFLEFLHEYLISTSGINRRIGSYYTPMGIAYYIASQAIAYWLAATTGIDIYEPDDLLELDEIRRKALLARVERIRILDPAVGGGAFLMAAAQVLLRLRKLLGDRRPDGHIRSEIVRHNLYGVDILPSAVECATLRLKLWSLDTASFLTNDLPTHLHIRVGNSLVGRTHYSHDALDVPSIPKRFDWIKEFPEIYDREDPGFDIIIGNPPYGNITSYDERAYIILTYPWSVSGERTGTWNSASLFLVRSRMLLNSKGQLGLLVPNSILRVRQFAKTRSFITSQFFPQEFVDEGSPFDGVTLETVTLFLSVSDSQSSYIRVLSRRPDLRPAHAIPRRASKDDTIVVLYHDDILDLVLERGTKGVFHASRGRDIPREHYAFSPSVRFSIPYAAVGRCVSRYTFVDSFMRYSDDWFEQDRLMRASFHESFLVATKNLPYPRCTLKPIGVLHGGGLVRITIDDPHLDPRAAAVILNSRFVRYLCLRYFTNYSQLTTCLNTGILEEIPVPPLSVPDVYPVLFEILHDVHTSNKYDSAAIASVEMLTDALVYELYLLDSDELHTTARDSLLDAAGRDTQTLIPNLIGGSLRQSMLSVLDDPIVRRVETSPRMSRSR